VFERAAIELGGAVVSRCFGLSALRHGRGDPFAGSGEGAPAALELDAPFDWPVSSSPTNAIFR